MGRIEACQSKREGHYREEMVGYLRTMFHYVVCVTVSQTHLCARLVLPQIFLTKKTHFSVQKWIHSCLHFNSNTQNLTAESTHRAVSIFCLYHVVLGSYLVFFSSNVSTKCLRRERRIFLLCSFWVSSVSDRSWDKHEPHFLWICRGWVVIFVLALLSPLKLIRIIGSIFLTMYYCLQNEEPSNQASTKGEFWSIDNKTPNSEMYEKAVRADYFVEPESMFILTDSIMAPCL